ncbi:MAG TPA: glucosylceramidase, partial [Paludibacter sp.]|nr:glucosylceramidase [Paludibacter sp.]
MSKRNFILSSAILFCVSLSSCKAEEIIPVVEPPAAKDVDVYVTTANKSMLFVPVPLSFGTKPNMAIETTINMKPTERYQEIDGFGAAITGSSCYNLLRMSAASR